MRVYRLAIQKDENDALKEALESTLEGKKEDFQYYQNIVEQTKTVFLHGLHQYSTQSHRHPPKHRVPIR